MEVTRRYWTVAGLGLSLAGWGVLVAHPLPVVGAAVVAGWLLVRQYAFVRAAERVPSALTLNLTTAHRVFARESAQLSLYAVLSDPLPVTVDVTVRPPVGARGRPATVSLGRDDRGKLAQTTLTWPVAGTFDVDDVAVVVTDGTGLFRQPIDRGTGVAVDVEPRAPRDIHVGEGGQSVTAGFGDHETGRPGGDVEPSGVREYVPGDAVRQIDWKSTARLDQPHVREFEGNTDRETLVFFDHRATMADGRAGTRKLDYARQVALAIVDRAGQSDDSLGYYAVGDGGVTAMVSPDARTDTWRPVRDRLHEATPTDATVVDDGSIRPAAARVAGQRLDEDDSPFGRTLAPFFAERQAYRRRFGSRPLYQAVVNAQFARARGVWTVIVTDDADRAGLREAVTYARTKSHRVSVFMTPTALFADVDVTDVADAYDRYVDFEEFRREVDGVPGVSAYEVGPADRFAAVLSVGRRRRANA